MLLVAMTMFLCPSAPNFGLKVDGIPGPETISLCLRISTPLINDEIPAAYQGVSAAKYIGEPVIRETYGFAVANIGFDSTNIKRIEPVARPKDFGDRLHLDWVTNLSSCSVHLNEIYIARLQVRLAENSSEKLFLGYCIGLRD